MYKNKILVFSHELPPEGGGAGVVGLQYCKELASAGFDVTLLTKRKKVYPINLSGIRVIGVNYIPKLYLFFYYLKLRRESLSDYRYIILNDMVSIHVAGFCFTKRELKNCISFLHGSEPEIVYKKPSLYQKITGLKFFYNKAIENVQRIISVSHYMKGKFLEETSFNDADKIKVIHSKLGEEFFPMRSSFKKLKCKQEVDVILTVSRVEKGKGFLEMYDIFKKLIAIDDSFLWQIVGDGNFKIELESLVKKDGLEKHISFVGKVERNMLHKYFENASVFWLLSNYKESFGLVYLEAQACLCPAIGYNRYGVVETIRENKTGFLVSNADSCIDIFLERKYNYFSSDDFVAFIESMHSKKIADLFNDA